MFHIIFISGVGHQKRRWNECEIKVFNQHLMKYVKNSTMPPTRCIEKVVAALKTRTVAQVRTRANNMLKNKQKAL